MAAQPPSAKQLALLRRLADVTGTTFEAPRDRRHASRQIRAMLARPTSSPTERDLDRVAIRGGELTDR